MHFLKNFCVFLIIISLFLSCGNRDNATDNNSVSHRDSQRPNVIFLFADDLNDVVLGGHPQVKSPNIDRLIASGMSFTNAHTNAPLCAPCRASILTGISPSTSGYFGGNQYDFKMNPNLREAVTFMEHFKSNGYKVMGTGKIFHHKHQDTTVWMNDGKYLHGVDASFGPFPWDGKGLPNNKKGWGVRHPGFPSLDTDALPVSLDNVPEYQPDPANGIPGYKGWRLYYKPFNYVNEEDRDLMPDELSAEYAVEQLNEKHDNPFLLCVGFNRPHAPLIAPKKYFDMFPLEEIILAKTKENDIDDCADVLVNKTDYGTGGHGYGNYNSIVNLGDEGLKKWTQAYLASVAFMDDQVGKILEALENSEYAENTIVFFSSDHGYHMGEKKWLFKNTLWGKATRVPFIFSGKGIGKGESDVPVSLVDFFPTIADLAGIGDSPNAQTNQISLDGKNLRPLLRGEEMNEKDLFVTSFVSSKTHAEPEGIPGDYRDHHTSIIDENYRYIRTYNGEEELYNIKEDPQEWNNLAQDGLVEEVLNKMRNRYENLKK